MIFKNIIFFQKCFEVFISRSVFLSYLNRIPMIFCVFILFLSIIFCKICLLFFVTTMPFYLVTGTKSYIVFIFVINSCLIPDYVVCDLIMVFLAVFLFFYTLVLVFLIIFEFEEKYIELLDKFTVFYLAY